MPTIINGCGTWYYGKRRVHRVKAPCSSCGAFAELESYDTTLYFVLLMVPVLPLGQKRILESCPHCKRHRLISLKQWEASKAAAFNAILEKLRANPDDRETIQTALGLATAYQDERLFDKLADALAGHRTDDADIQTQLGGAYEYFSRWPDAEAAYTRALAVRPDDLGVRERLALTQLKQYRPEEAAGHLRHVFESKEPDKAWLIYWLIDGFMAKGQHEQALKIMDVRDELYPRLAREKAYKNQRRTAERYRNSGRPVRSSVLAESAGAGFREGSGLGFKWPKYVAAGVFLALIALYLGIAIYRGQNRPVYLVNGWTKPYTIKVNGEEHRLTPGTPEKITVPEGEVTVEWPDDGQAARTIVVETSFLGRPFNRPVFVLNPDQLALIERDETVYSSTPVDMDKPAEVRTGQLLHRLADVDYEFEPFPAQIQAKEGSKITKTRVGVIATSDTRDRLVRAMLLLSPEDLAAYTKRLLQLNPDDGMALTFLATVMPPQQTVEYLRTRLADRPVRVDWHRTYQSLMEVVEPNTDLRSEYRRLVEETKRSPDAVYLLGRVENGPEGEKLYLEAAGGKPPSVHACGSLSFRYLARGEFDAAVTWAKKAQALAPDDPMFRQRLIDALAAAGKHVELFNATTPRGPTDAALYFRYRLMAHVGAGELGAAEGEINRAATVPGVAALTPAQNQTVAQHRLELELVLAEVRGDRAKYLELANRLTSRDMFVYNLLRGDYRNAAAAGPPGAKVVSVSRDWEVRATRSGLLYLAGVKAKDAAFADKHWRDFVESLGKGDREGRYYASVAEGKQPFDLEGVKSAAMNPSAKRVILAAIARKHPEHAKELVALAKKLDYERDGFSLCLRYVLE